jgi:chromosome segregation ATPase
MEKLLKSLSDFHDSQIQKLNSELNTKTSLVSALENMVQSLKEENISQKLEIQQLLFKIKELESMYVKSKEQLLEQENTFTTKQNSWNKFKEKIKEKISKKTESRYKVSKLVRGDRDLSVAESMPWAQKQKDVENRPGFAYSEVVRKKDERKRMNASDCACCKDVSFKVHVSFMKLVGFLKL